MSSQSLLVHFARSVGLSDPIKVLDVGANPLIEGDAPYVPLLRAGLAEVYGFEPQAAALASLNANKSDYETYFSDAVGDGQDAILHIYRSQGFTSLFSINPQSAKHLGIGRSANLTATLRVKTRRLDDLPEVPQVDLLKIDVQGAETQIIANAHTKLSNALVIITEARMFPIYHDEPRFGDLEKELTSQGFEFLRFASMKQVALTQRHRKALRRRDFSQMLDGDAIFVRDLRHLEQYDNTKLIRLAVISDSVLKCVDLTIHVLEVLEDRGVISTAIVTDYIASRAG